MKRVLMTILAIFMLCCSACAVDSGEPETPNQPSEETGYQLPPVDTEKYNVTFLDEFSGNALNRDNWNYQIGTGSAEGLDGWGNEEAQYYNQDSVTVQDGYLKLTARRRYVGGKNYISGRITTRNNFAQAFGRFEARIKLPVGQGLWPAFWLLPQDSPYGGWARSGEIDIMEAKGRLPQQMGSAIHYGDTWPHNTYSYGDYLFAEGDSIAEFHVYAVEWTAEQMTFFVDEDVVVVIDNWHSTAANFPAPFDTPFYIILNLAVGGKFDDYLLPNNEDLPAEMIVDYVRVMQFV